MGLLSDLCDLIHSAYLSLRLLWDWPKVPQEDLEDIEDAWDLVDVRY